MMKLSERESKAIDLIRKHPGLTAKQFGCLFWPDHPGHLKMSNQGNGACHGKVIWRMAGGYLGRLKKKGLVRNGYRMVGERDNGYFSKI